MLIPQLTELAAQFAADLQSVLREQAVRDIMRALNGTAVEPSRVSSAARTFGSTPRSPAGPRKGRRIRRNQTDLDAVAARIVEYVKQHPGERAEQIKAALKLSKQDWMVPVAQLLAAKRLKARGDKRSRTYSV
ncbi:MAG: hypothetical protein HOW73_28510 [Polyangiaceae bacterium]|nr:hypothetical protein [Polyangiaceae bacterium]